MATVITESFETSFGPWVSSGSSGWLRNSGDTGSSSTGPSTGYDGSYYVYVETSSGDSYTAGDTDYLTYSKSAANNVITSISFAYHQYGTDQGTLYLEQEDGAGGWTVLWSSTGDQGDVWLTATVAVTTSGTIRFHNVAAGGYRGDVALDLVEVTEEQAVTKAIKYVKRAGEWVIPDVRVNDAGTWKPSLNQTGTRGHSIKHNGEWYAAHGARLESYTASGAITKGKGVADNGDGTVSAISGNIGGYIGLAANDAADTETVQVARAGGAHKYDLTPEIGPPATFTRGGGDGKYQINGLYASCYDSVNDRVVIFYSQSDPLANKVPYAVVVELDTATNTPIFGTPVQVDTRYVNINQLSCAFDPNSGQVILGYPSAENSSPYYTVLATVDPVTNSLSLGTISAASDTYETSGGAVCYDTTAQRVVAIYYCNIDSYMRASVGAISGTSISWGSPTVLLTASAKDDVMSVLHASSSGKTVAFFEANTDVQAVLFTVGTNSITIDDTAVASADNPFNIRAGYDPVLDRLLVFYSDAGNSYLGELVVGKIDGSSLVFGAPQVFTTSQSINMSEIVFDSNVNRLTVLHRGATPAGETYRYYLQQFDIDPATLTATASPALRIFGDGVVAMEYQTSLTYSTTAKRLVVINESTVKDEATVRLVESQHFTGVDAPTTTVDVDTLDAVMQFTGTGGQNFDPIVAVYDPTGDRLVIAYTTNVSDSNRLAVIAGTCTDGTWTFGTRVLVSSGPGRSARICYDSANGVCVVAYVDQSTDDGMACVISGSGLTINAGTPVAFYTGTLPVSPRPLDVVYEPVGQSIVIVYSDATAVTTEIIAGTVSGTSISFGTATQLHAAASNYPCLTYDTHADRFVFLYGDASDHIYARFGTASGTTITVEPLATNQVTADPHFYLNAVYDPVSKFTIMAARRSSSNYLSVFAVTPRGGYTVGVQATLDVNSEWTTDVAVAHDPDAERVVVQYEVSGGGFYALIGQVDAVSGAWTTDANTVVLDDDVPDLGAAYYPPDKRMVGMYQGSGEAGALRSWTHKATVTPAAATLYAQLNGLITTASTSQTVGSTMATDVLLLE